MRRTMTTTMRCGDYGDDNDAAAVATAIGVANVHYLRVEQFWEYPVHFLNSLALGDFKLILGM